MDNKRLTVFSYYDAKEIIQDYVIYFLEQLRNFSDIIFVSDNNIKESELIKIEKLVIHSIVGKHDEYDFGSYKRGYQYALKNNLLEKYDELIFANDSCYSPLFPLEELFNNMSKKNVDFWGITSNFNSYFSKDIHIQSYFINFKRNVFLSPVFENFVQSIKKENSKRTLINNYEIGLTTILKNNGYKFDVYSEFSKTHYASHIIYYKNLLKERIPFLKRSIPLCRAEVFPIGIKNLILSTQYDYKYILADMINKEHLNIIRFLYKSIIRKMIISIRFIKERLFNE